MISRAILLVLLLLACGVLPIGAAPANLDDAADAVDQNIVLGDNSFSGRSRADISSRWFASKPTSDGSPYITQPSWQIPYAAGAITAQYQEDALNMVNYMRYLAGLPDDVVINDEWIELTQHGAVLLKAYGYLSHTPPKPADMPDDFYKFAYKACSSNNIAYGYSKVGSVIYPLSAADSVKMYMNDLDISEKVVGHRRWILNPAMKQTAFGWCESFSTMYAFDKSRNPQVGFDSIAWPPTGQFPLQLCPSKLPWSITLNSKLFTPTGQETVTMTRLGDNKTWEFSANAIPVDGMFTVDLKNYGVPYCIVFRPETSLQYASEDTFKITVSGLKKNGAAASISYTTTLFDLPEMQVALKK